MRLIYSPHDGGYYWERWDWKTSQVFPSKQEALDALRHNRCRWDD